MAGTGQPAWVKRILKLLEQARAKDPDFARFGAYSHQYKLAAPAGEEAIRKFEEQQERRNPYKYWVAPISLDSVMGTFLK